MTESKREIENYSSKIRKLPGRTKRTNGGKIAGKKGTEKRGMMKSMDTGREKREVRRVQTGKWKKKRRSCDIKEMGKVIYTNKAKESWEWDFKRRELMKSKWI